MPQSHPIENLSRTNRRTVLRDIASWKFELERNRGDPDSDPVAYTQELTALTDAELVDRWYQTVGEWVLSRDDVFKPPTIDSYTFLDYQFGLLLMQDADTEYGFLNVVTLDGIIENGLYATKEADPHDQFDDRTLYPENHRYSGYAPDGWAVYEEKNAHHIIFAQKGEDETHLCHVEADGISPIVSIKRSERTFTHDVDSFEDGLEAAGSLMTAVNHGVPISPTRP
jgi:hypothetical protein